MLSGKDWQMLATIGPVIAKAGAWDRRWDVAQYVDLCESRGFCNTPDMQILCAQRYLMGKRKVSPPGHRRKKEAEKAMKKALLNIPAELLSAIETASETAAAKDFVGGNPKSLDFLVGFVMKIYRFDPVVTRQLLVSRLGKNDSKGDEK